MGGRSLVLAKRADADEVRRSTILSTAWVGVFKVSRQTFHFEVIPRSRRAREAIRDIRLQSKLFKRAAAAGDSARMEAVSGRAWDALTKLFETLRNDAARENIIPHCAAPSFQPGKQASTCVR